MNDIVQLLVWRYVTRSTDTEHISSIVYLCFLGVFMTSFVLVLVMAIKNGFEHTLSEKMQGIHAHVIMKVTEGHLNVPAIQQTLSQKFPEVLASSPTTFEHALVRKNTETPTVVIIQAVDPAHEAQVTNLEHTILNNSKNNSSLQQPSPPISLQTILSQNNTVLMGQGLARTLGITVGDEIELLHADTQTQSHRAVTLDITEAYVSGLFATGIDDYDNSLIITSFAFLEEMVPDSGPTQLNLAMRNGYNEQHSIAQLTDTFKLDVFSWKKLYPALVSALTLEQYALFFILMLIMLIASTNIASLLFMLISQKRADIAILRAMGMPQPTIERLFIYMGMGITLSATIPGILLATGVSFILNHYQLISLPDDAYYVSYLPAHIDISMVMTVFVVIVIISFITVQRCIRATRSIPIAHVLRFES